MGRNGSVAQLHCVPRVSAHTECLGLESSLPRGLSKLCSLGTLVSLHITPRSQGDGKIKPCSTQRREDLSLGRGFSFRGGRDL